MTGIPKITEHVATVAIHKAAEIERRLLGGGLLCPILFDDAVELIELDGDDFTSPLHKWTYAYIRYCVTEQHTKLTARDIDMLVACLNSQMNCPCDRGDLNQIIHHGDPRTLDQDARIVKALAEHRRALQGMIEAEHAVAHAMNGNNKATATKWAGALNVYKPKPRRARRQHVRVAV